MSPLSPLSMPLGELTMLMSWGNRANGALVLLTGVLGIFGGLARASFSSALLSVYVGGFGALLLWYELSGKPETQRDFGFMFTHLGRTAFLFLIANLSWPCEPIGFWSAVLTNANALFSAYVMVAHPAYVEGRVSRLDVGGAAVDVGGAAQGFTYDASHFDPASAARRSSDGGRL